MPFTVLMGSLLAGLLAAGIPVLIHLLHRQRTTPLQWGAMQFLLESPLQLKRRRKIDHWLLMAVRMLLLAVLALLLARPVGCSNAQSRLPGNLATDIGIVIDHSLSTGRREGDSTLFAQSLSVVDKIAALLKPNDTLSVVLAEHAPQRFTALPVAGKQNVQKLTQDLRQLKPGLTDASIPDAVQTVRELIDRGRNVRKLIIVISDEQRSGWRIDDNTAWRRALGDQAKRFDSPSLFAVPVMPRSIASDVSVSDLTIAPGLIGQNHPAEITATIVNSGPKEMPGFNAEFTVNGKLIETRPMSNLGPGQSRTIRFDHAFKEAGSSWVRVRADVTDALAADNSATAAVNVWQRVSVLIIDGELTNAGRFTSSQFLHAAMQPAPDPAAEAASLVQPTTLSVSDALAAKLDDYHVVIVNDVPQLPADVLARLSDYARSGHSVWFILGPRSEPQFLAQDVSEAGFFTAQVKPPQAPAAPPPAIEVREPAHPTLALLSASERNVMSGSLTRQWWSLKPMDSNDKVLLATSGGDPLIFERPIGRNGGRVVVWCTSVDRQWNNWPAMPSFVPLVNETLFHLASSQTAGLENRRLDAGQRITWSGASSTPITSARVIRPDESLADIQPLLAGGRYTFSYSETFLPGLYQMRFDSTNLPQPVFYGIGIDRRELDNTVLSASDLTWLKERGYLAGRVDADSLATALGNSAPGIEMWKFLAFFLLGMLLLETLMTHRMIRHQSRVDVAGAGLASNVAASWQT